MSNTKEYMKVYGKKYRAKYRKEINEESKLYSKKYYIEHKEQKKLLALTPKRIYLAILCRARKLQRDLSITEKDFITWYEKTDKMCYYCARTLMEIKRDSKEKDKHKNRLTVDRKDNSKGYFLTNIVLACHRCNTIKGDYFTEKEMLEIAKMLYKEDNKNARPLTLHKF